MSVLRAVRWSKGPSQIVGFNYYPSVRFCGSAKRRLHHRAMRSREMERLAGKLPSGFGYEWTGQSLQEKLSGSQAPFLLMLSVLLVFLCPRRALRKLDHSACGAAHRAARHLRRGAGRDIARTAERRLFHRRPRDHHRARGQGRHPHHRVRQGPARARAAAGRGDDRSLHLAVPPDRDDRPRLRLRRAADGGRERRRRREPAGARHQRHGRHDRGRRARAVDGADVLRRRCSASSRGIGTPPSREANSLARRRRRRSSRAASASSPVRHGRTRCRR